MTEKLAKLFWNWDHSTNWCLNTVGRQNSGVSNPYTKEPGEFVRDYGRMIDFCAEHGIDAVGAVGNAAAGAVGAAANVAGEAASKAGDAAKNIAGGATDAASKAVDATTDAAKKAVGATTDAVKDGAKAVGDGLKKLNPFGK